MKLRNVSNTQTTRVVPVKLMCSTLRLFGNHVQPGHSYKTVFVSSDIALRAVSVTISLESGVITS
eukprot:577502-Hanusia_phi.AAC.2